MPKINDRKQLLKSLETTITAKIIHRQLQGDYSLSNLEQNIPEIIAYKTVLGQRYLSPRDEVCKAPLNLTWLFVALDGDRFRQQLRVTRASFEFIKNEIKDHPIYHYDPRKPQTDLTIQMVVALERLGMNGNGASVGRLSRYAGVSGTLSSCSKC